MKRPSRPVKIIYLALFLVLTGCVTPVQTEDRTRSAAELYDLLNMQASIEVAFSQLAELAQWTDDQEADLFDSYREKMVRIMSESYSQWELDEAIQFYSSKAGRSILSKQDAIFDKTTDLIPNLIKEALTPLAENNRLEY